MKSYHCSGENTSLNCLTTMPLQSMPTPPPAPALHHNTTAILMEEVESFKYLGSSFTATDQAKDEISGRIGLVRSAFTRLKTTLWSRREIPLKTKGRIYGFETWPFREEDLRRFEVCDNDRLRCILRRLRRDRVRCSTIRQRCSLRALPSVLLQRG